MKMVIPNAGKTFWLARALTPTGQAAESYKVRLFKNDYTPVDGSVVGSFTQADFAGYSEYGIDDSFWPAPTIAANVAQSTYPSSPDFGCNGGQGQLVYGWYMVATNAGVVVAAQRFDNPRNMLPGTVETLDPFPLKLKTYT